MSARGCLSTLRVLPARPVLAFVAPPMPCNAMQRDAATHRAWPWLELVEAPLDATHMDIEGTDTDAIARRFCVPGQVQMATTSGLSTLRASS
jgi:hypothetical protein